VSNAFVERLREHAEAARVRPAPAPSTAGAVNGRSGHVAFWQSPPARAAINRRVTGDVALAWRRTK
jgi:hypothetical protein